MGFCRSEKLNNIKSLGGAHRDKTRTLDRLMQLLIKFAKAQLKEQGVKS